MFLTNFNQKVLIKDFFIFLPQYLLKTQKDR